MTQEFDDQGHSQSAYNMIGQYKIGELVKYQKRKVASTTASEDSAEAEMIN